MKKLFLLLIAVALFAGVSNAQVKGNVVKLNIFSPLVSTLNIAYEKTINAKSSAQLGVAYTGYSLEDTKFSGIQITPEYRFYLSETDAPDGFYAAPFVRYYNFTLENENTSAKADFSAFGGGLIFGRHWLFGGNQNVSLDAFLGPSYSSGKVEVTSSTGTQDDFDTGIFDGFGLRIGVTFGLAF